MSVGTPFSPFLSPRKVVKKQMHKKMFNDQKVVMQRTYTTKIPVPNFPDAYMQHSAVTTPIRTPNRLPSPLSRSKKRPKLTNMAKNMK